jgi:hypothetical protein
MEWRHLKVMGDLGVVVPMPFNPKVESTIQRALEGSDIVINLASKVRDPAVMRAERARAER